MSFPQDDFISLAKLQGHSNDFISVVLNYAKALDAKGLPIIFSLKHFAEINTIGFDELKYIIDNRESFYKYYTIRKRSGNGERQIVAPYNTLKRLQRYIQNQILLKIPIDSCANGFVKGKSILHNAQPHSGKDAILNIDLFKFFDCITERRVYGIFKSLGYAKNLCVSFAQLITVKLPDDYIDNFDNLDLAMYRKIVKSGDAVLPQGSPTSPTISNIILRSLDKRLLSLAIKLDVSYTRYADDLTFSGDLQKLPKISLLRNIIRYEGFLINWNKVGIYRKGRKQLVTGLTVSNGTHVPQEFKKEVSKHIYCCIKFGVANHNKHIGNEQNSFYREWLLGKILFIKSIEQSVGNSLLTKFNKIDWEV